MKQVVREMRASSKRPGFRAGSCARASQVIPGAEVPTAGRIRVLVPQTITLPPTPEEEQQAGSESASSVVCARTPSTGPGDSPEGRSHENHTQWQQVTIVHTHDGPSYQSECVGFFTLIRGIFYLTIQRDPGRRTKARTMREAALTDASWSGSTGG